MKTSSIAFKAQPQNFINKQLTRLIKMQEGDSGMSASRFIQDTAVNWFPKAIFSRSLADFSEMSLLEFSESILVYFFPKLLGEKVFRKAYSRNLPENLKDLVAKTAPKILKDKKINPEDAKKLMAVKAAISISGLAIPIAEYSLNYVKNLFTLKMFKQADFNNIANLNKDKKEEDEKQKQVKKSAIKHLKIAAGIFGGCLALSALLVKGNPNSKIIKNISETVLAPGNKIFRKDAKKAATFNKYFSLDFSDNKGVLGLSRGQLTSCVLAGAVGYLGAAKDRGKQNFLEVLFRYPLVGFYVVTGSELLEKGFKSVLKRKGVFTDVFKKNSLETYKLKALPKLAKNLAAQNHTTAEEMYKKLFKQKAIITGIPFLFSIGFMGLFVAGMSRAFTQYRYNKDMQKMKQNLNFNFGQKSLDEFKIQSKTAV